MALSVDTKRMMRVASDGSRPDSLEGLAPDAAHEWRHDNVGRLLLFAFHAFEARLLEGYRTAGFADVRQVHLSVLRHIDSRTGTRIVDLALRAGVTKGAMGQLVDDCVKLGLVTVAPDPADGRAKIVRFARRGRAFMRATHATVERIEADFARLLGAKTYAALRAGLTELRERIVRSATD